MSSRRSMATPGGLTPEGVQLAAEQSRQPVPAFEPVLHDPHGRGRVQVHTLVAGQQRGLPAHGVLSGPCGPVVNTSPPGGAAGSCRARPLPSSSKSPAAARRGAAPGMGQIFGHWRSWAARSGWGIMASTLPPAVGQTRRVQQRPVGIAAAAAPAQGGVAQGHQAVGGQPVEESRDPRG